jgi:predicted MFS family arabinose efflux permease
MSELAPAIATQAESPPGAEEERSDPIWLGVVSIALGVFGLVTAEFLPASLLTPIAADLGVSVGTAGQAVTATAVVGAITAPTMGILTGRLDRRLVLCGLSLLLVVSCLLSAAANGLVSLLVARVLLGVALGGFWSMSAALAMRLVPMSLLPRAMSIILTGVSFATVCAAPVGAWVGEVWGWRAAFLIAGGLGVVALAAQMLTIPRLPPLGASSLRTLAELLTRPAVRLGLVAVLLVVSGHFAGFTYVRPFLEQGPGLDVAAISLVLLAYGVGGFFGNFAGAFAVEHSLKAAVGLGALLIAATAGTLVVLGQSSAVAAIAVAVWGFAFGALPVGFQTWMVRAAPDQAEGAGGLLVAAFQVAIASGAVLGGVLVDGFGASGAIVYCGAATLAGALAVLTLQGRRRGPRTVSLG